MAANVMEIYGSKVFNEHVMKERLPSATYKSLERTLHKGAPLDIEVANVVASVMKRWAMELGATHYTHWFQPLTGITSEKHDGFVSPQPDGTAIMDQMTTDAFNLKGEDGQTLSIGYCYEAFGIIVNKALLEKAGHSIDEITNFESLKAVADDIHARADELGFDAFSSAGLEGSSSWRFSGHLANMPLYYEFRDDGVTAQPATITGAYLENFKNIWDLYTTDSATTGAALATATGDESEAEFGEGKAAFYQNGTWEYSNLTGTFGMDPADLAMIPIYCGVDGEEKAGLCAGTENCWAINNESSEEDIQATIDFLVWVVTSDEGTTMLAEEFGPCPFKDAKDPENVFFQDANKYTAEGNYVVTWAFNWTPAVDDWRAAVVDALTQYTAGTGDWSAVETAFVQGWANQYAKENA